MYTYDTECVHRYYTRDEPSGKEEEGGRFSLASEGGKREPERTECQRTHLKDFDQVYGSATSFSAHPTTKGSSLDPVPARNCSSWRA